MNPKSLVALVAAALSSVAAGYLNTHTDELLVVLPAVVLAAGALGLAQPRLAWLWAAMLGLSLPLSAALFLLLNLRTPYPNDWPNVATSLAALAPALVAAYLGAGIRLAVDGAGQRLDGPL